MRIGIMLRALDEKGGIGVYSDNLTRELLDYDRDNAYILYYRSASNLGRFDVETVGRSHFVQKVCSGKRLDHVAVHSTLLDEVLHQQRHDPMRVYEYAPLVEETNPIGIAVGRKADLTIAGSHEF